MDRRRFLLTSLVGTVVVSLAHAQAPDRVRRIGFISLRAGPGAYDAAFREALRGLGYVEGRTVEIEYRWAADSESRVERYAAELVAGKMDVLVAATTAAIRAAMRATSSIPIVMAVAADPIGSGLVRSLSHPGGNVTGLTLISTDTGAKRLQLLQDLIPAARRIGVLLRRSATDDPAINARLIDQLQRASRQLGLSVAASTIHGEADIEAVFATFQRENIQALIVPVNSLVIDNRVRIVQLAATHRLPVMYEVEAFVAAGGLLSYGPSLADMYRRAAIYVDRILKGAKPADLPIEQPTKFDLVINLKTAKALGLTIPPSLLLRADQVIE